MKYLLLLFVLATPAIGSDKYELDDPDWDTFFWSNQECE